MDRQLIREVEYPKGEGKYLVSGSTDSGEPIRGGAEYGQWIDERTRKEIEDWYWWAEIERAGGDIKECGRAVSRKLGMQALVKWLNSQRASYESDLKEEP